MLPATTVGAFQAGMASTFSANPFSGNWVSYDLSSANANKNNLYCGAHGEALQDSSTTLVASTWYRLSIHSDGTKIHWFVDGSEVCGTGYAVSNLTTGGVQVALDSTALSGTSISFVADYIAVQMQIPTGTTPSATQR